MAYDAMSYGFSESVSETEKGCLSIHTIVAQWPPLIEFLCILVAVTAGRDV